MFSGDFANRNTRTAALPATLCMQMIQTFNWIQWQPVCLESRKYITSLRSLSTTVIGPSSHL